MIGVTVPARHPNILSPHLMLSWHDPLELLEGPMPSIEPICEVNERTVFSQIQKFSENVLNNFCR